MPTDKILMTASALSGIYGLQLTAMPAKSGETFYNVSSPTRDAVGVAKWLGFAQCMNVSTFVRQFQFLRHRSRVCFSSTSLVPTARLRVTPHRSIVEFLEFADSRPTQKIIFFLRTRQATNMAIIANSSDDEARKRGKMAGAAFSFLGAGMAVHQQSANGMDKTQVAVAAGSNIVLGALLLKDALGK